MEAKPGYLTTEFWLTVANTVFMALVAFGVVGQEQANDLQALVVPLIGAIIPLGLYILGRAFVKSRK